MTQQSAPPSAARSATAEVPTEGVSHRSSADKPTNVVTLDAIRAIAALGVLVFHVQPLTVRLGKDIPGAVVGQTGVLVFFVLSGYLISTSVLRAEHFSVRDYLVRRAARILPLYYLSMGVVLLIDSSWLLSRSGLVDLGLHALLIHGVFRDHNLTIYAVWWTLSAEWFFYLIMGAVARWFRGPRLGWFVAAAFITIGVGWRILALDSGNGIGDRAFLTKTVIGWLDVFGLGMLAALTVRTSWGSRWLQRNDVRWGGLMAGIVGFAIAIWAYLRRSPANYDYWKSDLMVVGWPLFAAAVIALLLVILPTFEASTHRLITWTGLAYVGQISYGVYVFHPLVIQSLSRSWAVVNPSLSPWVLIPLVIAATVVVSALSHHLVERPAMAWGRSRTRRVRGNLVGTR